MNTWEEIFRCLSCNPFFAKWLLLDGSSYYMYLPELSEIGTDRLLGMLDTNFDELSSVEVIQAFRHNDIAIDSDVDLLQELLEGLSGVRLSLSKDGVVIELEAS